jgi:hypothetical protein
MSPQVKKALCILEREGKQPITRGGVGKIIGEAIAKVKELSLELLFLTPFEAGEPERRAIRTVSLIVLSEMVLVDGSALRPVEVVGW